jgi:hypothetical protein
MGRSALPRSADGQILAIHLSSVEARPRRGRCSSTRNRGETPMTADDGRGTAVLTYQALALALANGHRPPP